MGNSPQKKTKEDDFISDELKRIQELEEGLSTAYNEIEELKKNLEKAKDAEMRSLADAQNIRRRTEEDRGRLIFESGKSILSGIIESLDNFDLAMQNLPEDLKENVWVLGISAIERKMYESLTKEGLQEISEVNVALDPHKHEVVMNDAEGKQGIVTKILQKGFLFHGKTLRPARVSVGTQ